jgi:hypothetical protein
MSVYNQPLEYLSQFNTKMFGQPDDTISQAEGNQLYLSKTISDTSTAPLTTFDGQVVFNNQPPSSNTTPSLPAHLATLAYLTSFYQPISLMSNYLTTAVASTTYLTIANAASTYQPISLMVNYLTTASASSTYQPISLMVNYLTIANAASTYLSITTAASTYLTQVNAASTYQPISLMVNYLTTASAASTYQPISLMVNYLTTAVASTTYLTIANAASTYLSITNAASTYLTQANATSTYQTISGMTAYLTTALAASTYLTITTASTTYQTIAGMTAYLTTSLAASTYLTITNAASTYLTITNAASTYLSITNAASTYLTQANAALTYLTQANAASTYLTITNAASTYLTQATAIITYAGLGSANIFTSQLNKFNQTIKLEHFTAQFTELTHTAQTFNIYNRAVGPIGTTNIWCKNSSLVDTLVAAFQVSGISLGVSTGSNTISGSTTFAQSVSISGSITAGQVGQNNTITGSTTFNQDVSVTNLLTATGGLKTNAITPLVGSGQNDIYSSLPTGGTIVFGTASRTLNIYGNVNMVNSCQFSGSLPTSTITASSANELVNFTCLTTQSFVKPSFNNVWTGTNSFTPTGSPTSPMFEISTLGAIVRNSLRLNDGNGSFFSELYNNGTVCHINNKNTSGTINFTTKDSGGNPTNPIIISSASTTIANNLISNSQATFSNFCPISNVNPTLNTHLVRRDYVENNFVDKTSNQIIGGDKTFNGNATYNGTGLYCNCLGEFANLVYLKNFTRVYDIDSPFTGYTQLYTRGSTFFIYPVIANSSIQFYCRTATSEVQTFISSATANTSLVPFIASSTATFNSSLITNNLTSSSTTGTNNIYTSLVSGGIINIGGSLGSNNIAGLTTFTEETTFNSDTTFSSDTRFVSNIRCEKAIYFGDIAYLTTNTPKIFMQDNVLYFDTDPQYDNSYQFYANGNPQLLIDQNTTEIKNNLISNSQATFNNNCPISNTTATLTNHLTTFGFNNGKYIDFLTDQTITGTKRFDTIFTGDHSWRDVGSPFSNRVQSYISGNNLAFVPQFANNTYTFYCKDSSVPTPTQTSPLTISSASTTIANNLISNSQATFNNIAPISNTAPTQPSHLTTRAYVDSVSGSSILSLNNTFTGFNTYTNGLTIRNTLLIKDSTNVQESSINLTSGLLGIGCSVNSGKILLQTFDSTGASYTRLTADANEINITAPLTLFIDYTYYNPFNFSSTRLGYSMSNTGSTNTLTNNTPNNSGQINIPAGSWNITYTGTITVITNAITTLTSLEIYVADNLTNDLNIIGINVINYYKISTVPVGQKMRISGSGNYISYNNVSTELNLRLLPLFTAGSGGLNFQGKISATRNA